jgi:hypothetical protein
MTEPEILAWFDSIEIVSSLIVCPFAIPACVSGVVNGNEVNFDMADWLPALKAIDCRHGPR